MLFGLSASYTPLGNPKMLMSTMQIIFLVFIAAVYIVAADQLSIPTHLHLGTVHKFTTNESHSNVFCYSGTGLTSEPSYLFKEVFIHVEEAQGKRMPWYSVRGMSTDDVYAHFEDFLYDWLEHFGLSNTRALKAQHQIDEYLRDAFTACPNPLFSTSSSLVSKCVMQFSTVGRACVKIVPGYNASEHLHFVVYAEERLNWQFVYRFLFGLASFFVAGQLSGNAFLQYTAGAAVFICGGLLPVLLLGLKYIARARGTHTKYVRNGIIAVVLSFAYFTLALWFLRQHWYQLVLRYRSFMLGYVVVTGLAGLVSVQMLRNNSKDQVRLTRAVKWIIRTMSVVVLYHSTASPFGSLTLLSLTVLLYITYVLYKPRRVVPTVAAVESEDTQHTTSTGEGKKEKTGNKDAVDTKEASTAESQPEGGKKKKKGNKAKKND